MSVNTILLIDDNSLEEILVASAIAEVSPHIQVRYVSGGSAGLEYLCNPSYSKPELVLVDINMPLMSGFEFLEHVNLVPELSAITFVMYSTSSSAADIEKARKSGASFYVVKPTEYDDLVSLFKELTNLMAIPPPAKFVLSNARHR